MSSRAVEFDSGIGELSLLTSGCLNITLDNNGLPHTGATASGDVTLIREGVSFVMEQPLGISVTDDSSHDSVDIALSLAFVGQKGLLYVVEGRVDLFAKRIEDQTIAELEVHNGGPAGALFGDGTDVREPENFNRDAVTFVVSATTKREGVAFETDDATLDLVADDTRDKVRLNGHLTFEVTR